MIRTRLCHLRTGLNKGTIYLVATFIARKFSNKNKNKINYASVSPVAFSVAHSEILAVPRPIGGSSEEYAKKNTLPLSKIIEEDVILTIALGCHQEKKIR